MKAPSARPRSPILKPPQRAPPALLTAAMTHRADRHQLFISYSRVDREWVDRLKIMLAPLLRGEDLRLWDDSQIPDGAQWKEEIAAALAAAKVALLLVSSDFLSSEFIHTEELPQLLRAAQEEGLVLLWVKLRPCLVHRTPIHAYQAAINPDRPLVSLAPWEQEAALETLAQRIEAAFQRGNDKQAQPAVRVPAGDLEVREAPPSPSPPTPSSPRATGLAPALPRQRLADSEVAELVSSKGLVGQSNWRVERHSQGVWGLVEQLAPGVELQLVEIEGGRFSMGSPPQEEGRDVYKNHSEEWKRLAAVEGVEVEAQRLVTVPGFWLGRFPITQAQWQVVAGWPQLDRPLDPDPARFKGADRPVERVSWHDAVEFCRRLSQGTGRPYTLPSEALWEYACRAGTTTPFHYGPTLSPEVANYDGNVSYASGPKGEYREHTTPVGSFPANAWGLHDMHGNVWEWCLDRWHPSPRHGPSDGRPWLEPAEGLSPEGQELRLLRGGSWFGEPRSCRSASRDGGPPAGRNGNVGFRVCSLPPGLPSWPLSP
ncbi:MAG: SUMF1/EgtB/PvdO family nonheme iron enzyme [Cyanobacteriota bacterium]